MESALIAGGVGALTACLEDNRNKTAKNAVLDSARQGAEAATAVILAQLAFTEDPTVSTALLATLGTLSIRLLNDSPHISETGRKVLHWTTKHLSQIVCATNVCSAAALIHTGSIGTTASLLTAYSLSKFASIYYNIPICTSRK